MDAHLLETERFLPLGDNLTAKWKLSSQLQKIKKVHRYGHSWFTGLSSTYFTEEVCRYFLQLVDHNLKLVHSKLRFLLILALKDVGLRFKVYEKKDI